MVPAAFPSLYLCFIPVALRIEWAKSRARAHRWQEECALLLEEIRRVKSFFNWEAVRWDARAKKAANEGPRAYAHRQAAIRRDMLARFVQNWQDVAAYEQMGTGAQNGTFETFEYTNLLSMADDG